jgi:hypothetical protein
MVRPRERDLRFAPMLRLCSASTLSRSALISRPKGYAEGSTREIFDTGFAGRNTRITPAVAKAMAGRRIARRGDRIAWSYMETQMIKNKLACFLSIRLSIPPNVVALGTPRCGSSSDPCIPSAQICAICVPKFLLLISCLVSTFYFLSCFPAFVFS